MNIEKEQIVTADASAMGLDFIPQDKYDENMTSGYWVLLVVYPGFDYHWYRQDPEGSWSHKTGEAYPITGVIDPIADAKFRGYIDIVGYFYVTGGVYENKE